MDLKILESKTFKIIILVVAGLIILLFVFSLGVFIGEKKADFTFRWVDKYHQNFAGPQRGIFGEFNQGGMISANGVFGKIISINENQIIVIGEDGIEKNIITTDKTIIMNQRENIESSDLDIGDTVIIIGTPNSLGQIEAQLIRVMPPKINIKDKSQSNGSERINSENNQL